MSQTLEETRQYWNSRAEGYTLSNREELEDTPHLAVWEERIQKALEGHPCHYVLDVGCGPGFFSILLAKLGYEVTAIDYTENMLAEARKNAADFGVNVTFLRMDAQNLDFEDERFDLVISRNVLWNLEAPEQAYREWMRVLKRDGTLMNFDGNFYYYVTDEEYGDRTRWEHKHMQGVSANPIDRIGEQLPLARKFRPEWDMSVLKALKPKKLTSEVTNDKILQDGHRLVLNFFVTAVK